MVELDLEEISEGEEEGAPTSSEDETTSASSAVSSPAPRKKKQAKEDISGKIPKKKGLSHSATGKTYLQLFSSLF